MAFLVKDMRLFRVEFVVAIVDRKIYFLVWLGNGRRRCALAPQAINCGLTKVPFHGLTQLLVFVMDSLVERLLRTMLASRLVQYLRMSRNVFLFRAAGTRFNACL